MSNIDTWESRKAIFLDWNRLDKLLRIRLFELLGWNVVPHAFQDGDYWDVDTEVFSPAEMNMLLDTAGADSEDRKNHIPNTEGKIHGLTDAVSTKLLSPEMPFVVDKTVPTEDGVYFLSAAEPYVKDYSERTNPTP